MSSSIRRTDGERWPTRSHTNLTGMRVTLEKMKAIAEGGSAG